MSAAQIVTIGKNRYLAGMIWHSFDENPDKANLRAEAERLSADWYALRPVSTEVIQAGFAAAPANTPRPDKLISLAAIAAGIMQEPWLGIYEISEDLYWYVAVRDGYTILPDGDVIGTRAEVEEARNRHIGYDGWQFEVDSKLDDLIEHIDNVKKSKNTYSKPVYIKALHGIPIPFKTIFIGLGIVLAIAACAYLWTLYQDKKAVELAALRAQQAALAAQKPVPPPPPVPPSASLVRAMPDEWLDACRASIGPTPLSLYGWDLAAVTCTASSASLDWKRSELASIDSRPDGVLSPDGNLVSGTVPIAIKQESKDNRVKFGDARLIMQSWSQKRWLNVQMTTSGKPEAPLLPGATPAAPAAPVVVPEQEVSFSFSLPFPPSGMQFDSIPGVRLTSIKFSGDTWEITGSLYGK